MSTFNLGTTPQYPDINGIRYDWSSIEIAIFGNVTEGIEDIDYSNALEPGEVRGTRSIKIGRTRGQLKAEASMTMYKTEWLGLLRSLGDGYMEIEFDINVSYADTGQPTTSDTLVGCRIKKHQDSPKSGSEPAKTKIDFDLFYVAPDGFSPTTDT